jgi:hypothetical protein
LKFDGKPSEVTTLKLIHELEVHQIELERRIALSKEQAEQEIENTLNYYHAPGYFTLSQDGKVTEANLTGAHMLGAFKYIK